MMSDDPVSAPAPELVDLPAPTPTKAGNGTAPPAFIDRVLRLERGARKSFHATWWDECADECWIFWRPYTLGDADAVESRQPKSPTERLVLIVIQKAEREDGSRLFEFGHRHALMHEVSGQHLQVLADEILGIQYPSIDQAKEAITADPPSASA